MNSLYPAHLNLFWLRRRLRRLELSDPYTYKIALSGSSILIQCLILIRGDISGLEALELDSIIRDRVRDKATAVLQ